MPELPEVEALRSFLNERLIGATIARTELLAFSALKTFQLPLAALHGAEIAEVRRLSGRAADVDDDKESEAG